MLKIFKTQKNSAMETTTVQAPEKTYMSAKDALNIASKKWSTLPTDDIFAKIQKYAEKGERQVHFSDAYINGKQLTMLKELGYKVDIYTPNDCHPFFVVTW